MLDNAPIYNMATEIMYEPKIGETPGLKSASLLSNEKAQNFDLVDLNSDVFTKYRKLPNNINKLLKM